MGILFKKDESLPIKLQDGGDPTTRRDIKKNVRKKFKGRTSGPIYRKIKKNNLDAFDSRNTGSTETSSLEQANSPEIGTELNSSQNFQPMHTTSLSGTIPNQNDPSPAEMSAKVNGMFKPQFSPEVERLNAYQESINDQLYNEDNLTYVDADGVTQTYNANEDLGEDRFGRDVSKYAYHRRKMHEKFSDYDENSGDFSDLGKSFEAVDNYWGRASDLLLNKLGAGDNPEIKENMIAKRTELMSQGLRGTELADAYSKWAIGAMGDVSVGKDEIAKGMTPLERKRYEVALGRINNRKLLSPNVKRNPMNSAGTKDVNDELFGYRNIINPKSRAYGKQYKNFFNEENKVKMLHLRE